MSFETISFSDKCRYSVQELSPFHGANRELFVKMICSFKQLGVALTILAYLCLTASSGKCLADEKIQNEKNTNGFFPSKDKWFEEGNATTVFSEAPVTTKTLEVGFFKEKEDPKPLVNSQEKIDPSKPPPFDTKKATTEQLESYYGNPDEDAPLTPEEKAPVPFKAMMSAMNAGNDELAYKYARQYVRYMRNVSDRVKRVVDFQEVAVEREGIRPGNLQNNPYVNLLEKDFQDEKTQKELSVVGIDPRAQSLIKKAQLDESTESKSSNIPVDPKGEVDVLFFFSASQMESKERAGDIENISSSFVNNPKIHFLGLSMDSSMTDSDLLRFADSNGLSIPVQQGQQFASRLGIQESPAVLLVTRNSKALYKIQNNQSVTDIVKVIRVMSGGQR